MIFNLEYYRSFYNVALYGSFSKAADFLCVSQPAVTQSVQKLERALGCRLFQRIPHGVVLTPEGETLFQHVSEAFSAFEIGERKVSRLSHYETGEIKIGTTETPLYQYLLPSRLSKFQKRFPKIHINITGGSNTSDLYANLKSGLIDIAFVVSPLPEGMNFDATPLQPIQDIFIAGPPFDELRNKICNIKDLLKYPLTCVSGRTSAGIHLTNWLWEQGITLNPQFSVRTSSLVLLFVKNGYSIGVIPRCILSHNKNESDIFEIQTEKQISPREIYLVVNQSFPKSALCREFISSILADD